MQAHNNVLQNKALKIANASKKLREVLFSDVAQNHLKTIKNFRLYFPWVLPLDAKREEENDENLMQTAEKLKCKCNKCKKEINLHEFLKLFLNNKWNKETKVFKIKKRIT